MYFNLNHHTMRYLTIAFLLITSIAFGQGLQNVAGAAFNLVSLPAAPGTGSAAIDAAGESYTLIGRAFIQGGATSKTISTSGGKIVWRINTVTFANAGTNLRIGIQDVAATGLEDGTFDAYADLVGGTDVLAGSTTYQTAIESGTKTITNGDMIAISFEFTSRAGSDAMTLNYLAYSDYLCAGAQNFPYKTSDTGAGPVKSLDQCTTGFIIFDDGTFGWISIWPPHPLVSVASTAQTYNTGSTPDEYAAVFKLPYKATAIAATMAVASIATTDNFEFIIYTDPLGTPAVLQSLAIDPDFTAATSNGDRPYTYHFTSALTIEPDTWYGIAVRPTTANSINVQYMNYGSGNNTFKRLSPYGENIKWCGRTNQTGAFVETQTYHMPIINLIISALDDGKRERSSSF
jgi:hypothetical protein